MAPAGAVCGCYDCPRAEMNYCDKCYELTPCGCDFLEHFPLVRFTLCLAAAMSPSEISALRKFFQMLDHWQDVHSS